MADRPALRRQCSRDGDGHSSERRELHLVSDGVAKDVDNRSDIARQRTFAWQFTRQLNAVMFFERDSSEYLHPTLDETVNRAASEEYRYTVLSER